MFIALNLHLKTEGPKVKVRLFQQLRSFQNRSPVKPLILHELDSNLQPGVSQVGLNPQPINPESLRPHHK